MFCILPFYAIGGEYILRKIRKFFQYDTIGMLFVFPAFLYMLVFVGYPIVRNIILSLQDVTMANLVHGMKKFVGFQNYIELFKDSVFRTSLINTLVFTVRCLVMQFIIGFALAIFFNKRFAISKPLRGILLVPWMIPITVTALIFKLLFATDIGVLNYILKSLHLVSENIEWLTTPQTAMFALICANVWIGIPFNMILISTGLTTIPKDLYESASIDGDQVMTALELDTDAAPCLLHHVPSSHHAVVEEDEAYDQEDDDGCDDAAGDDHDARSIYLLAISSAVRYREPSLPLWFREKSRFVPSSAA